MLSLSHTEENYLKAIFKISAAKDKLASTNEISRCLNVRAASVSDMLKRLSKKKLIRHEKHRGVSLTKAGQKFAIHLVRKHRLWEVFLVNKLGLAWEEVHDIAEELEHIESPKLIDRLDAFLGYPSFDPHGDPIPDAAGKFTQREQVPLSELPLNTTASVVGVTEHSAGFLKYLNEIQIQVGRRIRILERQSYDKSIKVKIKNKEILFLTHEVAKHILVQTKK